MKTGSHHTKTSGPLNVAVPWLCPMNQRVTCTSMDLEGVVVSACISSVGSFNASRSSVARPRKRLMMEHGTPMVTCDTMFFVRFSLQHPQVRKGRKQQDQAQVGLGLRFSIIMSTCTHTRLHAHVCTKVCTISKMLFVNDEKRNHFIVPIGNSR